MVKEKECEEGDKERKILGEKYKKGERTRVRTGGTERVREASRECRVGLEEIHCVIYNVHFNKISNNLGHTNTRQCL